MNTLTFTTEQAAFMSAIACNEAKADYTALAEAINGCRPDGQPNQGSPVATLCLHGFSAFSECPWHFAEGFGATPKRKQSH